MSKGNNNLSQIRELMLGSTIKTYSKKMDNLKSDLQKQIDDLHTMLKKSEESIESKLLTNINKKSQLGLEFAQGKVKNLEEQHHELIYRKYSHMRASLNKLKEDVIELQRKQNLKIDKLKAQMKNEINNRFSELEDSYVSKQELSAVLIELGCSFTK